MMPVVSSVHYALSTETRQKVVRESFSNKETTKLILKLSSLLSILVASASVPSHRHSVPVGERVSSSHAVFAFQTPLPSRASSDVSA